MADSSAPSELEIRRAVRDRYTSLAQAPTGVRQGSCDPACCGPDPAESLERLGYTSEQLASLPSGVQEAAAGCGVPTALADLQPGQVVVDLGSGGGIDVLLAAKTVGPTGRAVGVDATPEMVWRAREAAKGILNAEFRLGEIEHLPLEHESADVVLSNCVINLAPDKGAVFREAFRVLRPGGQLAISDIVFDGEQAIDWPEKLRSWAGCVAGAISKAAYLEEIRRAGFEEIEIVRESPFAVEEMEAFVAQAAPGAKGSKDLRELLPKILSVELRARKPK